MTTALKTTAQRHHENSSREASRDDRGRTKKKELGRERETGRETNSTSAHMCVDFHEQFQLLAAQRDASIAAKYEATYEATHEATHEATAASSEALDRTSVSSLRRGIC